MPLGEGGRGQAIAIVGGTHPTGGEKDIGEFAAVVVDAIHHGIPETGRAVGDDTLGQDLRQRS